MTKHPEAKIVLLGGRKDGWTVLVDSHEEESYEFDGDTYVRKDEQQGDHRVYQYTISDGSPYPGVEVKASPELENRLQADLDALAAERKAHGDDSPKVPAA